MRATWAERVAAIVMVARDFVREADECPPETAAGDEWRPGDPGWPPGTALGRLMQLVDAHTAACRQDDRDNPSDTTFCVGDYGAVPFAPLDMTSLEAAGFEERIAELERPGPMPDLPIPECASVQQIDRSVARREQEARIAELERKMGILITSETETHWCGPWEKVPGKNSISVVHRAKRPQDYLDKDGQK